ncbi:MAG: CinA family protein [Rickettsiales bacterium]
MIIAIDNMFSKTNIKQATALLASYKSKGLKLAAAESCTGGLITALLTETPGSSRVFECGFVTYSNQSKIDLLGVSAELIEQYGSVSDEVARAMAQGVIAKTGLDIAVSVTGIAGPSGGSAEKPVGLVYIAVASKSKIISEKNIFSGDRQSIRLSSVAHALNMLQKFQI